ncbi:MAG TPA: hypothetical protein VGH13_01460 [Xanthobacteraceae bacterium]
MPPETDCKTRDKKRVLVGLAVVFADGIDPRLQTLSPDLLDNDGAGLVYDGLIERRSDACRGKHILQRSHGCNESG